MAYDKTDKPILEVPVGLEEALSDMISKAVSHTETAFNEMQEEMTDYYKGELPGITEQDRKDGRSEIVSRDVHDAVMATMPDLMRIFTGADHVLEFEPAGPNGEEQAQQATEAIRQIFEKENDAFSFIHGSLKDGLVRKFAVGTWWHEYVDESYNEDYTLGYDEYVLFMQENEGEVEVVKAKVVNRKSGPIVKATLKHLRYVHKFHTDLVPPEELILSPSARTAKGDHLIGRRQNLRKEQLEGMGYDPKVIEENATSDGTIKTSGMAAARAPDGQTQTEEDEDTVLYCEVFLQWPHEDRLRLFKVCTLGDGHEIVACEPVDEVNMALFTPDPEPHTPVGESQAEKVRDIQKLKTGVWRGIIDSLAEALVPRMEVVEGQTNIDDAMSTEIGGLIRVRQPNMVRPVSQPFVGQQAIPLLESVDVMREERVGAFRAQDGLTSEAMQSATSTAVAATISGSKAPKELLARIYAETFLKKVFRGLLKLFVQHQDKPKMMKLTGGWVPVDPSGWNADMGCSVDVAQAMLTVNEKAEQLAAIAEKQEQIMMQMGPTNPIVHISQYAETLREMVRLTGRRNPDKYFKRVDPNWAPPPAPPQEDPAMMLARSQDEKNKAETQRKEFEADSKNAIERRRHKEQMDLERDKMAQTRSIELLKLAAQYGISTEQTELKILADIEKHRETLAAQAAAGAADRDLQASQSEQQLRAQSQEADKDRIVGLATGMQDREHQAGEADKDRQFKGSQEQQKLAVQDQQHQRSTKAQEKIAAQKAKTPAAKKAPKK